MSRALTIKNVYDKKHVIFDFDGVYLDTLGNPEKHGAWIIYGPEKNGKTWATLLLANYLTQKEKVLYVSAEEGIGSAFGESCERAKISPNNNNIHFVEYETLEELYVRLKKRSAPKIVIIDNITFYNDELKNGAFRKLLKDFSNVLFIFIAHEERGQPYTATAKLCKKIAKIIIQVKGLACVVSGRCPGGTLIIDEQKAALYHGHEILSKAI